MPGKLLSGLWPAPVPARNSRGRPYPAYPLGARAYPAISRALLSRAIARIGGRLDPVAAAVGERPHQDARLWLIEPPALYLFGPVMTAAQRGEVAFARPPALVIGHGVVLVATSCRATATGERAGPLPDPDHMPQRGRGLVAGRFPLVQAVPDRHRPDRDSEFPAAACRLARRGPARSRAPPPGRPGRSGSGTSGSHARRRGGRPAPDRRPPPPGRSRPPRPAGRMRRESLTAASSG